MIFSFSERISITLEPKTKLDKIKTLKPDRDKEKLRDL
jgi:hypothetical protein